MGYGLFALADENKNRTLGLTTEYFSICYYSLQTININKQIQHKFMFSISQIEKKSKYLYDDRRVAIALDFSRSHHFIKKKQLS